MNVRASTDPNDALLGAAIGALHSVARAMPPTSVANLVAVVADVVGARAGRLYVADYGLRSVRELGADGPIGEPLPINGTLQGRVFSDGNAVTSGADPTVLLVPLVDGTERVGILELDFDEWNGIPDMLGHLVFVLVGILLAKTRYSDAWVRCRRAESMSAAAEVQWDLLPPLAASADNIDIAGILEPAYAIGGDSFDYALNHERLDFAIVDAMGHGMSAVLMAAAAINGFRNVRREGGSIEDAYGQVDRLVIEHFGNSCYVTGQIGSLNTRNGQLRWINAGHPLPLLVRNGSFVGPLSCRPTMPMGLGGTVVEIAEEPLQSGDRVLFYTDGITESRSSGGTDFGEARLADHLVRATLERVSVSETVRRLSNQVLAFAGDDLADDATMFLVEYRV